MTDHQNCSAATDETPPDWKQDQAETSRLPRHHLDASKWTSKAAMEASHARSSAGSEPVAFVPIHPRQGPLWSDTFPAGSEVHRSNSYPRMALYAGEPQTAPVASWQATDTPIYSKDEFAAMASGVILTMAEGCCSAINPCSHQQRDPRTICETCKTALSLSRPQSEIGK